MLVPFCAGYGEMGSVGIGKSEFLLSLVRDDDEVLNLWFGPFENALGGDVDVERSKRSDRCIEDSTLVTG